MYIHIYNLTNTFVFRFYFFVIKNIVSKILIHKALRKPCCAHILLTVIKVLTSMHSIFHNNFSWQFSSITQNDKLPPLLTYQKIELHNTMLIVRFLDKIVKDLSSVRSIALSTQKFKLQASEKTRSFRNNISFLFLFLIR